VTGSRRNPRAWETLPAQGLLAARGVFGQEHVGTAAVGADGQGVFGKPDPSLFPEGPVQARLGLVHRGFLVRTASQPGDMLPHKPLPSPGGRGGRVRGRVETAVVLKVDVPRRRLRRSRKGLWFCPQDIPPGRVKLALCFAGLAGTSTEA
jgi:hypothetical protein